MEEKNRSWCSSSNANDQRAITIECASDTSEPYAFRDVVYQKLIVLCVDICKRNGKKKLLWFGDKEKTLNYSPKADEMVLTVHRWFANKSCPGNWLYARMGDLADKVTAQLEDGSDSGGGTAAKGTQASALRNLSEADAIKKVGALFTADQKKTGILASVSLAQFILESGYGKSELAQNANNVFGMKCSLSGNTWTGSTWDGTSKYTKQTKEQNADGSYVTITADFRKYPCVEDVNAGALDYTDSIYAQPVLSGGAAQIGVDIGPDEGRDDLYTGNKDGTGSKEDLDAWAWNVTDLRAKDPLPVRPDDAQLYALREDGTFINQIGRSITVEGQKLWSSLPAGYPEEDLPAITFALYQTTDPNADIADSTPVAEVPIKNWENADKKNGTYVFTIDEGTNGNPLPKYDEEGQLYHYQLTEKEIDMEDADAEWKKLYEYRQPAINTYVVENVYLPRETGSITVRKLLQVQDGAALLMRKSRKKKSE